MRELDGELALDDLIAVGVLDVAGREVRERGAQLGHRVVAGEPALMRAAIGDHR